MLIDTKTCVTIRFIDDNAAYKIDYKFFHKKRL